MVYQRVSKPYSGNSQIRKKKRFSLDHPTIPVQAKSVSASPQEQEMPSYTPLAANWVTNNNLMRSMSGAQVVQRQEESGEQEMEPIQAKLTIGQEGDKYEQEADQTAQQVVNQINAPAPEQSAQGQPLQREEIPEEEELQMKSESGIIQREEMPEEEELQMKSESGIIQREEMPEEDELQMKSMVQRRSDGGGMAANPDMEASIQQAQGGGQPLADNIQKPMEQAFGADFSGVNVHTDAQSDQLNQSIQAKAFTTGQDVFFRQGAYDPGSRGGQELLAHELTHVVQQNGSKVQRRIENQVEPDRVSAIPASGIQRKLMSRSELETQAGTKGASRIASTNYERIVKKVEQYEHIDKKDLTKRLSLLDEIQNLHEAWKVSKDKKKKQTSNDSAKRIALRALADSIHDEKESIYKFISEHQNQTERRPELASEKLDKKWREARASAKPEDKVAFMNWFNDNYADALTGEIEFLQYLAQKIVYLKLEAGTEVKANVKSPNQSDSMVADAADKNAQYSTNYELVQRYVGDAGMVALLMLPQDRDKTKNAIVAFRGTAATIDALSKLHNEPTGVRTDTDWRGVASNAYKQGKKEMETFYSLASPYAMTTVAGHSLGGALAQRFYQHISKKYPDSNLRLATYQSAPIDEATASNIGKEQQAKVTYVRGRGDIVPKAGSTHIPGETVKYNAIGDVSKHLAIPLANAQIDKVKTPQDVLEIMDYTIDKVVKDVDIGKLKSGDTNAFYSGGRRFGGVLTTPVNIGRDLVNRKFVDTHVRGGKKEVQSIEGIDDVEREAAGDNIFKDLGVDPK